MKIYLASSWRNPLQPYLVNILRNDGHEVYDFKNPAPGDDGFHWSRINGGWRSWDIKQLNEALVHPLAVHGFKNDWDAMQWADTGVLLLPSGRSAHLEAGYFVGAGKPLYITGEPTEPELMYKMGTICPTFEWLRTALLEE